MSVIKKCVVVLCLGALVSLNSYANPVTEATCSKENIVKYSATYDPTSYSSGGYEISGWKGDPRQNYVICGKGKLHIKLPKNWVYSNFQFGFERTADRESGATLTFKVNGLNDDGFNSDIGHGDCYEGQHLDGLSSMANIKFNGEGKCSVKIDRVINTSAVGCSYVEINNFGAKPVKLEFIGTGKIPSGGSGARTGTYCQ